MKGNVSRETIEAPNIGPNTWQQTLFPGEVQPGIPGSSGEEISERAQTDKRSHDRARQQKTRKKAKDNRLIEAVVTQIGFHSHQLTRRVFIHYDSHIWDSPSYNRDYYQEAAKVIFTGPSPDFRGFLLLLVVRISNQTGSPPLSLINYLTTTYGKPNKDVRLNVGAMGIS